MRKLFSHLLLQSALFASFAHAAPYPPQNVIENAVSEHAVDFEKVAAAIAVLQQFAGDYPVQFDNDDDRKLAEKDLHEIAYLFHVLQDSIQSDDPNNYPIFLMKARSGWIAHNLNIEGGRESAAAAYLTAISLAPDADSAELNEELGRFLSSAALMLEGEKYLRKAYETRPQSALPLAMNLIAQKDMPEKLEEGKTLLQNFLKQNPDHEFAKMLLESAEHGRLNFKTEAVQPNQTKATK